MFRWMWWCLVFLCGTGYAQQPSVEAMRWADSVFRSLSWEQRIGQLMIVRMSGMDAQRRPVYYEQQVSEAIRRYNIGGVCVFQGGPLKVASLLNKFQEMATTPILVSIDGENGLAMRLDSILPLPRQMMMGAVTDPTLIYEYGRLVGKQCRRLGVHMNFGPVVDVNNNPANPVINDRSFGEDKYKVALFGIHFMRGMQDAGVMACAKHFPGHGDVTVDSHLDLPVLRKSRKELDSLELYPFRQMATAGVASMMVAHLAVPAIDPAPNTASSISAKHVANLLKEEIGYKGLVITDALEMGGVTKYNRGAELSIRALEAGNDLLCLPQDIPGSVAGIIKAMQSGRLKEEDIEARVKKLLAAKYMYGLARLPPVELDYLTEELNAETDAMRRLIARNAITVLRNEDPSIFPLAPGRRVAYVGIGTQRDNAFSEQLRREFDAHVYHVSYRDPIDKIQPLLDLMGHRYDVVIIGLHQYNRFPAGNFGITLAARTLVRELQRKFRTITMAFGNPYAISNFCDSRVLVACYEDDSVVHRTAADLVAGRFEARGQLPVTICEAFQAGDGLTPQRHLGRLRPADLGMRVSRLAVIDSIVTDAIRKRATPGATVLVARKGKIVYERSFGFMGYDSAELVYPETVYDLASVTKILATTLAVMKLYEDGKIVLSKTLGDYLSWTKGTNKQRLSIWNLLLHQAGLKAWIPFYRETLDPERSGSASFHIYASMPDSQFAVRVADNMYMRKDWKDTLYHRILTSSLGRPGNYVYSDLDFIFLGEVVESVTGMPLDEYVSQTFYEPLGLRTLMFNPRQKLPVSRIAPTETEPIFRAQTLRGDVHDPAAAMFGGVAGHAGLFGTAYEVAVLAQLLLNGGELGGIRFFQPETVRLFTGYRGNSRRGLGFDKPEKDNRTRRDPYPAQFVSSYTFGHTGFTGTCVWVDPAYELVYVFLSNRVYSNGDPGRFNRMNVRGKVQDVIYRSFLDQAPRALPEMQLTSEDHETYSNFAHSK